MNKLRKGISLVVVGFGLVFGGAFYHVYAVENLSQEVEEVNETVEVLEEEQINYSAENKSISEELEELENEYRQMQERLEETNEQLEEREKELEEKEQQIEQLNRDLEAKLEYEANLAEAELEEEPEFEVEEVAEIDEDEVIEESVAEIEPENDSDKSQVLSEETEVEPEQSNEKEVETSSSEVNTRTLGTFTVTFYAVGDGLTPSTTTANGTEVANTIYSPEGYRIIAVDTSVIPMNTIVRVTLNGETFLAKSSDTGNAIKGNKIDLLVSSPSEAIQRGVQTATVEVVE